MNKTKELMEVIEGFQNLTARIKDDNDSKNIKLKKKDLLIDECKKQYRKLHAEHENLKNEYLKLKSKIDEYENENKKNTKKRKKITNDNNNKKKKKKKKIVLDYSSDDNNENKSSEEEEEVEEEEDSDYEIVKMKKNKKKTKQKKVGKVKGIIDYINSRKN